MISFSKISNFINHKIQSYFDKIYEFRHPSKFERLIIKNLMFFFKFQPNDRWNIFFYIQKWFKFYNLSKTNNEILEKKNIFIFSSYRGNLSHTLCMSNILLEMGHSLTIGYLPKLRSSIKSPKHDSPNVKKYLNEILSKYKNKKENRFKMFDLSDFDSNLSQLDISFLKNRAKLDTIFCLRKENLDFNEQVVKKEFDFYLSQGFETAKSFEGFLKIFKKNYDIFIFLNGSTFDTAITTYLVNKHNLKFNCIEKFSFRKTRLINHQGNIRTFSDLDLIWKNRKSIGLLEKNNIVKIRNCVQDQIKQRMTGNNDLWVTVTQKKEVSKNFNPIINSKSKDKPILISTNVPFDAGYDLITTVFDSMSSWLHETLNYITQKFPDRKIIIRAHPDEEKYKTSETVYNFLKDWENSGLNTKNIILFQKNEINTYQLFDKVAFGIVFSSTIGLEMAIDRVPVILGSKVYYSNKGFTVDSKNREEYFSNVNKYCLLKNINKLDKKSGDLASIFHYLLHNIYLFDYPYDKPSDMVKISPDTLPKLKNFEIFKNRFDVLSMDYKEWRKELINIYSKILKQRLN